jgi:Fic family protein
MDLPPLIKVALIHAQFETIHPFLDGNGRIGRLLIAALFEHWGLLREPLMYLSGYLKQHQAEYYRRLSTIRTEGDWESWVSFFLEGVAVAAADAEKSIVEVASLVVDPQGGSASYRLSEMLLMIRFTITRATAVDTTFRRPTRP